MEYGLNLDKLPVYCHSSFRSFAPGEKHITRICADDVLILMLGGTLSFKEEGTPILLREGEYNIQQKGLKQEADLPSGDAHYFYVHFKGSFASSENQLPLHGRIDGQLLYSHMKQLERLQSISASLVEKNAEFYAILSCLRSQAQITSAQKTVQKVVSLLAEDYEKTWSLAELASLCGYSKNNLIRIFKDETGKTPLSFITEIRLQRAKLLLENSDMQVGEIAQICGFGSYINFYKTFRRMTDCSPELWRQNHRYGTMI